ncbi:MAG: hypothetical protein HXX08_14760 [Chloroflexi bacterium]|uniref:Uncharacterized protein n=1 Tax=Candidatus Chlorohelix allophototropha TaxID=3003348 RepID=A0A8T7M4X4_9CHLR|nr:hypothetical protein [Chloroflexota bacterium]WJW70278.1 hypothetical protein OZ401_005009 [Chloroflexota bacterium L227-S17]
MNPITRYILVGLGILAVFALVATIITLTLPKHEVSEIALAPTSTAVPPTTSASPTLAKTQVFTATPTIAAATETIQVATPSPTTIINGQLNLTQVALTVKSQTLLPKAGSLAPPVTGGNGLPAIEEKPYLLPNGVGPSAGAKNCPNPLPLPQIREDYMAYWTAVQRAHKEVNFDILKPYLDPTSRDGQYFENEKKYIDQMRSNGYFIEYQIIHSDPLKVKINPQSFGNICYVLVIDAAQVSAFGKKMGTNEPVNEKQPVKYQFPPGHGYMLTQNNGHWIVSNEGADSDQ